MEGWKSALVFDPGTDTLKAGFSGQNLPCVVVPNLVGIKKESPKPKQANNKSAKQVTEVKEEKDVNEEPEKAHHVGHEVKSRHGQLTLKYPVHNGIITDFDILGKIISHIYKDVMKLNSREHPVLFTELPVQPRYVREQLVQTMFEQFEVPGFYVQDSASLSLMSAGLLTGTVLESGDSVTTTGVVVDGVIDRHTIPKTFYAGRDVSYNLLSLLIKKGYEFHSVDKKHVREIKESLGFVSEDYERDMSKACSSNEFEQYYHLPSGEIITINEERFQCTEGLFHPERFGCDSSGIHSQVNRSLDLADEDIRTLAGENIVFSGGNTMFSGFKARLKKELGELMPESTCIKVHDLPDRKYAAWIGGSTLTLLDSMRDKWISKQEYEEEGVYLVEKKCV